MTTPNMLSRDQIETLVEFIDMFMPDDDAYPDEAAKLDSARFWLMMMRLAEEQAAVKLEFEPKHPVDCGPELNGIDRFDWYKIHAEAVELAEQGVDWFCTGEQYEAIWSAREAEAQGPRN
jgi:hypothetical protein